MHICYNKIPKSEIEHQEREKRIEKWQQQWDNTTKRLVTKEFFSKHYGQTKNENQLNSQLYGNGNSPWKNKIIPTSIQDNRVSRMHLCQRSSNSGSPII